MYFYRMASLTVIVPQRRRKSIRFVEKVQVIDPDSNTTYTLPYRPLRLNDFFMGGNIRPGIIEILKHAPQMLTDEYIMQKILSARKRDEFSPKIIVHYLLKILNTKIEHMKDREHTSISSKLVTKDILVILVIRLKMFLEQISI